MWKVNRSEKSGLIACVSFQFSFAMAKQMRLGIVILFQIEYSSLVLVLLVCFIRENRDGKANAVGIFLFSIINPEGER